MRKNRFLQRVGGMLRGNFRLWAAKPERALRERYRRHKIGGGMMVISIDDQGLKIFRSLIDVSFRKVPVLACSAATLPAVSAILSALAAENPDFELILVMGQVFDI
ncbi:MAG: hypothetical protein AAGN35_16155 [Bacteroidota bacterium]